MGKATDEIRARFDELGIKWWPSSESGHESVTTYWLVDDIKWVAFEGEDNTLWLNCISVLELTPEQAIAATAGAGTCFYVPDEAGFTWWDENDVEHYEEYSASDECCSASCDKCGYTMMVGDDGWFDGWDEITEWTEEDGSYHKGYILKPRFKHCPNCGRRLVSE